MVKISADTYEKLHYLSLPFETRDETLNRILTEYPNMEKKVKVMEDILVEKKGDHYGT